MRRKIIALFLALALGAAMGATALGADSAEDSAQSAASSQTAETAEQVSGQTEAADASTDDADDAGSAAASGAEDAKEDAPDTIVVDHAALDIDAPDSVDALHFADVAGRVREHNATYLALQEIVNNVNEQDFEDQIDDIRDALNAIAKQQEAMLQLPEGSGMQAYEALESQYQTLRDTFDNYKNGRIQNTYAATKRQMENSQDQLVQGAETLYLSLLDLQIQRDSLQRTLDATDRSLKEMELRYALGQISALTLQQVKSGRASCASGLVTLDMNLYNLTCQLQQMIGADITGELTLADVPEVTEAQVSEMDFDTAFAAAQETSYALYNAQHTLDEAKLDFRDTTKGHSPGSSTYKSAQHTWAAAQYTYQATVDSYELSFRSMFDTVNADLQALKAAKASLTLAEGTYAAQELKYQQGNLSKNAYLDAQDDLAAAQESVTTAQHALFTAYRSFYWAVERGVLN